jgi:hypothetical protein
MGFYGLLKRLHAHIVRAAFQSLDHLFVKLDLLLQKKKKKNPDLRTVG